MPANYLSHGIDVMPGKPLVLGTLAGKPVLGCAGLSSVRRLSSLGKFSGRRWKNS
jgi:hypothetical protein